MSQYAKFDIEAEYKIWHDIVKVALNLPWVNMRASDGEPQPHKQQTVRYNESIAHPINRQVIAIITDVCPASSKLGLILHTRAEVKVLGWFPARDLGISGA